MSLTHLFVKRAFDLFFSGLVLVFGLPVFFSIALLIKCSSKGPIFYASIRLGKQGKKIKCWKFRSMYQDADQKLQELLLINPLLKKEWDAFAKLKNDPRITPFGHFLRKTSLDEIPQFWNVFKGDLSLVGPRPYLVEEIHSYLQEKAKKILSVRPGLTGLWQISGRNQLTFKERVQLEETYIEIQSLRLDFILICKTIPAMFFPKGAY